MEETRLPGPWRLALDAAGAAAVAMGMEVDGPFDTPRAVAPVKLMRHLPIVLACFAAFWLADYFITAARVAPVLLERETRRKEAAP